MYIYNILTDYYCLIGKYLNFQHHRRTKKQLTYQTGV